MFTKQAADTHDDLGDVTNNILRDAGLEHDALLTKGLTRRAMLFSGGASLAAAVIVSGQGAAWAQTTDNVTRIQPRAGFTVPFPKNWVADHVTDDVNPPIHEMPRNSGDSLLNSAYRKGICWHISKLSPELVVPFFDDQVANRKL